MRKILLASMLTSAVFYSPTAVTAPTKEYARCLSKANAADPEISKCMSAEYERQDRRLNAAYTILRGKLNSERKNELQEVQRLWLKYSNANCNFYHDSNGGTAAVQLAFECSINARAARAEEIEELIKSY